MSSTLKPTDKPKGKQAFTCAICALLGYAVLFFGFHPKQGDDDSANRNSQRHVAATQLVK